MFFAPASGSLDGFFKAADHFFTSLAEIQWGYLVLALLFFGVFLTWRARASFNVLRAAYPTEHFQFRKIWGAYVAAYGFNNVFPGRGGTLIRLFLTKGAIPNSTYPTVAAGFMVDVIFDLFVAIFLLAFAFSQGVFPKPPDFSKLNAFDLSYLASHPRFMLFLLTALGVLALVAFALLSVRVKAFWARVRQGLVILTDRRRYLREVFALQAVGWIMRFIAYWLLLDAFNVGGSVRNVMFVYAVAAVSSVVPLTPGGAGVQQALLVKVFSGAAAASTVAAYSVGQQVALAAFTAGLGLAALFFIFRFRSFREVIRQGRAERAAEAEAKAGAA